MIDVELANKIIAENLYSLKRVETIDLNYHQLAISGEVFTLAQDVIADRDYPPYDRVMMDGVALASAEMNNGRRDFIIEKTIKAGDRRYQLSSVENCVEVMTGAALPLGCDLVIPYEQIEIDNNKALLKNLEHPASMFIHTKSSDYQKGHCLLSKGTKLNAPVIGLVSSVGLTEIKVVKPLKILLVATGDELVSVEQKVEDHQIRISNIYALAWSLKHFNVTDQIVMLHLADDYLSLESHFKQATLDYDWIIYSGAVSKGKYDYLPQVWQSNGVEKLIHGVWQKPGKPLFYGIDYKNQTQIIGLPGNPISSLITLHRYFLGITPVKIKLNTDITVDRKLTRFLPVRKINDNYEVVLTKNSGDFHALLSSDGFIQVDPKSLSDQFDFYAWRLGT
jgi:molybdopterin molybdotransferase